MYFTLNFSVIKYLIIIGNEKLYTIFQNIDNRLISVCKGVEFMKYIFFLILLFLPLKVYADCYTGFACSVSEIQKKQIEQEQQIINFINSYFDRQVKEFNYTRKESEINEYRDIFVYYKKF